jgi:hypothetical protein
MQEHIVWFGEADSKNLRDFPLIVFKSFNLVYIFFALQNHSISEQGYNRVDIDIKLIFANTTPCGFNLVLAHTLYYIQLVRLWVQLNLYIILRSW